MTAFSFPDDLTRDEARHPRGSFATLAACLWLGLFPLLHFGTYTTLTRDKWICMFLLLAVTVFCLLADGSRNRLVRPARLPALLAGLLLGWMVLSCLASEYGADDWWIGASARKEGLLTQICYLMLFFCFACARISIFPVLCSAVLGVLVFLIMALIQRAGVNLFGLYPPKTSYLTNPEFQGPMGNVDMGAGYLCLMSGLFLSGLCQAFRKRRNEPGKANYASCASKPPERSIHSPETDRNTNGHGKSECHTPENRIHKLRFPREHVLLYTLCLVGLALSVFLLFTMDVSFALISLGAVFLLALLGFFPRRVQIIVMIALIVLVFLVLWLWPGQSGTLWEMHEILQGRAQPSYGHNRVAVWTYSLRLAGERLLPGGGSDTFEPRFNTWLRENSLTIPKKQGKLLLPSYFDNPHNEYLAQLVNHGLPALLLYLALILTAVFHPRFRRSPFRFAVFAYAVQAFFSFSICVLAPMFWVTLGLCCSETTNQT